MKAMFESQYEAMPRPEIVQLQLERLQSTLSRVYRNVKFYRQQFDRVGFLPEDLLSLDDLAGLPFTTKEDLSNSYPYGMFAVPLREVVRIHSSSGSAGNPMVVGYTSRDLRTWARLAARLMTAAGVGKDDVVQITFNYGLMTGGFGIHYGAEALGASVIPTGTGNTFRQVQIMRDYRTTVLVSTPSYALVIADKLQEIGLDPKELHLRLGLMGGEPWDEPRRQEIESRLLCRAYDLYGLSEAMGPGVAGECEHRAGMHLNEDHFLPEIIDPATGHNLMARRDRRTGYYHPGQGSRAADPFPHRRPVFHHLRALPLRPHLCPYQPHPGPHRRGRHCQGRQYLPPAHRADSGRHPG